MKRRPFEESSNVSISFSLSVSANSNLSRTSCQTLVTNLLLCVGFIIRIGCTVSLLGECLQKCTPGEIRNTCG